MSDREDQQAQARRFRNDDRRRRALAGLPIEEKIELLIRLQEAACEVLRARRPLRPTERPWGSVK